MSSYTTEPKPNYPIFNKICEFVFDSTIRALGISLLITLVIILLFGFAGWMVFIAITLCIFYIINWYDKKHYPDV